MRNKDDFLVKAYKMLFILFGMGFGVPLIPIIPAEVIKEAPIIKKTKKKKKKVVVAPKKKKKKAPIITYPIPQVITEEYYPSPLFITEETYPFPQLITKDYPAPQLITKETNAPIMTIYIPRTIMF